MVDILNNNSKNDIDINTLYNNLKDQNIENKKEESIILLNCLECNSTNIIENFGYYICKNCGIRYNNIIDSSQEWRYYGSNDNKSSDPSRCGIPTNDLNPNSSMGSIICSNSNTNSDINMLRKIHSWNSTGYMDTTFNKNSKDMESIALNNGINKCIIEEAKFMYKKITYDKYKKKAKKEAIQAACIQCACKINNVPRDSTEMALMFNISKKDMRKGAKQFEEMWSVINEENKEALYTKLKPCNSTKFLQRRTRDLKLSNEIMELCKEVCTYVEKEDYLIKHIPLSITAGCIYFTCEYLKIPVNKTDITSVCSISEVTINKCYKKLINIRDNIIENTSLKEYK
jgi:transcription initiation factor TFIIB